MTALFIPPTTVSHAQIVPYISVAEYRHAPTAVDTSSLVTDGSEQDQLVELANVIDRASGWANDLCSQILQATLDTEMATGLYVRRDGTVRVPCSFWPVRELDSFQAGPSPSTMTPITDTKDVWLDGRQVLVVPVGGLLRQTAAFGSSVGPVAPGGRVYAQWAYWNGWMHTSLASTVSAGATSLPLRTALPQAAAGTRLVIVDSAGTELVTVDASFTGGMTLPLAAPTANKHTVLPFPQSIPVTELPSKARQAAISLTSALIKVRGSEAYVLPDIEGGAPSREALIEGGGLEDLAVAVDLLERYRRV